MARCYNPAFTPWTGKRGSFRKQIVYRIRGGVLFVSKYPNMKNVKPTELQLRYRERFAEAVRYARQINNDPVKKAAYPVPKGKTVYQTALKDYLNGNISFPE
jgi:hypothetical protein